MENVETVKKSKKKFVYIGIGGAVVLITALLFFFAGTKYESTDNAQLDGDIISIRSGITGYIDHISFEDNQPVKKGDTLIVFDAEEVSARVMQAEAALENAQANLLMVQNKVMASNDNANASELSAAGNQKGVSVAKTKYDKSLKDLERINELFKIKGATQEQVDNAQANFQVAQSEYNRTIDQQSASVSTSHGLKAQANAEHNQVDIAKATIKQKEAELTLAKKQLSYAYVVAPCNGIVTKRNINAGQYLTVGQSMCAVVNTDHYWVTANYKESQLENIKIGAEVEIKFDSYPGLKLKGKVESFAGATGSKFSLLPPDNATGNFIKITQRFPIRISIENIPKEKIQEIFPGLSVVAKVKVG